MRRVNRKGFTLVELLVVMAIIAILASIAIPNVVNYIRSARATRAVAEISGFETALTKMLADSNRSSLHQLFNPEAIQTSVGVANGQFSAAQFERVRAIYSNAFYVLLRQGRGALTAGADNVQTAAGNQNVNYASILNQSVVSRLGTSYVDIGLDPWGNLYQFYPGPWPGRNGANIFRIYRRDTSSSLPGQGGGLGTDDLSLGTQPNPNTGGPQGMPDPDTGELTGIVGSYPADRNKVAFIYSFGQNLISGQAIYQFNLNTNSQYANQDKTVYYPQQEVSFMGGGDDVNNWDNNRSWEQFYN